eukprot:Rmarinus@m.20862
MQRVCLLVRVYERLYHLRQSELALCFVHLRDYIFLPIRPAPGFRGSYNRGVISVCVICAGWIAILISSASRLPRTTSMLAAGRLVSFLSICLCVTCSLFLSRFAEFIEFR